MVSFVCEACQDTVKKPKVEQHSQRCRGCFILSCVDCGKDFKGPEYATHTSCISEAEKHQKSLYKPKAVGNKDIKPQPIGKRKAEELEEKKVVAAEEEVDEDVQPAAKVVKVAVAQGSKRKWRKEIAKQLEANGGSMKLKALRKALNVDGENEEAFTAKLTKYQDRFEIDEKRISLKQ